MLTAMTKDPYRVIDKNLDISSLPTYPVDAELSGSFFKSELKKYTKELGELQHQLFAEDRQSLLVIFQAMDAAGKDSTIRAVMRGVNPAGCEVYSFKKPSSRELDHDFLWRTTRSMPERGRIGVFNRSYYEETLVVRVHTDYLKAQRLPALPDDLEHLWQERFESINDLERHMTRNGTTIVKFWLNVSKDEQKRRFLSRLDEPHKHWKFSAADVKERAYWDDYMHAYQEMLRATSTRYAPWYTIPADNKKYMRMVVAKVMVETLRRMNPQYPKVQAAEREKFAAMRQQLETESIERSA